jgi:putative DNA primase/helicase
MKISNDGSDEQHNERQWWFEIVAAIHHETRGSDEGRTLAHEWSGEWPGYDAAYTDRVWDSLGDRPGRLQKTGRYVLKLARANGWRDDGAIGDLGVYGEVWFGERFAERFLGQLLYVPEMDRWLRWTGVGWTPLAPPELDALSKMVAQDEVRAAHERYRADPTDVNKSLKAKAEKFYESLARIRNIPDAAKAVPGMWTEWAEFDRDPMLLGVRNGVLDLRTGELLKPDPSQRVSKRAGAYFEAGARCPQFLSFLRKVQPDRAMRGFLQRAVGYTLTGLTDEEKWFFLFGPGANGKSVFANILSAVLGDYAVTLGSSLVTKNKHENEAERLKARLPGRRLALVNEIAQGDLWDDQRMKELTSREKLSARLLHREAFDFMPTHALWVRGNHLPGVLDAGHGFWRRFVPIPFECQLSPEDIIPDLDRRIVAEELSGILNWALAGALKWQADGLKIPAVVRTSTAEYREDTDLIGMWLRECCQLGPRARVTVSEAFTSFRRFCDDQGVARWSKISFSRALKARGLEHDRSRKRGRAFIGAQLLSPFTE